MLGTSAAAGNGAAEAHRSSRRCAGGASDDSSGGSTSGVGSGNGGGSGGGGRCRGGVDGGGDGQRAVATAPGAGPTRGKVLAELLQGPTGDTKEASGFNLVSHVLKAISSERVRPRPRARGVGLQTTSWLGRRGARFCGGCVAAYETPLHRTLAFEPYHFRRMPRTFAESAYTSVVSVGCEGGHATPRVCVAVPIKWGFDRTLPEQLPPDVLQRRGR